jgi:saccharopine dehydrogenase-like NADP-dependent oxidoreductase
MNTTIAVVGGGRVGRSVCAQLRNHYPKATLKLLDLRATDIARRHADEIGDAALLDLDLTDSRKLERALDVDLVVNTAGPFYRHGSAVLQGAIATATHYVDVCDESRPLETMRALDGAARQSGTLAVIGCGFSPGFTNVVCGNLQRRGLELRDVDIAWCMSMADPVGRAAALHALHIVRPPARHLHEGQLAAVTPLAASRTVLFPPPFGDQEVFDVEHSEPVTLLAAFPDLRNSWVGGGILPTKAMTRLRAYAELELTSDVPIEIRNANVHRADLVGALDREFWAKYKLDDALPKVGAALIVVRGVAEGKVIERRYAMTGSTASATAAGAVAGVETILRRHKTEPGVHFSEEAIRWSDYAAAVLSADCKLFAFDHGAWSRIDGDQWLT